MTEEIQMTVLGSGSSGNCTLLEKGDSCILIDAGFSGRQIGLRLEQLGRKIEDIDAVVLTHEHSDHTAGLSVLGNRHQIPIYCNRLTADYLKPTLKKFDNWKLFETGNSFQVREFEIQTFAVPHDAYDPVGFLIQVGGVNIGFLTDLGYATKLVVEKIRKSNVLLLEANYDLGLLRADTKRPWSVKQRILARHGHLSNESAAKVAAEVITPALQHLFLGHLSEDCNTHELAESAIRQELEKQERGSHLEIHRTYQKAISRRLVLKASDFIVASAQ